MIKLNNRDIIQSEQLKRNGRIPESSRSIRLLYNLIGQELSCLKHKRVLPIAMVGLLLSGCGSLPAFVGTSASTYETYKTITFTKTGADIALAANDMPTTNDYALSKITGYDCKVSRVLDEGLEAVCQSIKVHAPDGTTINKNKEKK